VSIAALRPGQILVSKAGSRVVYVRTEARSVVVGESEARVGGSRKRLLKVPVKGGEEVIVVRTLFPVRDNTGQWQPGQELNGRYSQADLDAGVLTPTDEFATDDVPDPEPRPKRAGRAGKEAAVDDSTKDPAAGDAAATVAGGTDAPVVVKERKPRAPQAPDAMVVGTFRATQAQRDQINAAAEAAMGKGNSGAWILKTLLSAASVPATVAAAPVPVEEGRNRP
jgi:hypothetical protein